MRDICAPSVPYTCSLSCWLLFDDVCRGRVGLLILYRISNLDNTAVDGNRPWIDPIGCTEGTSESDPLRPSI